MHPISNFVSYEKLSLSYKAFATALTEINIPKSIQEALVQPEWKKAVMEEVNALEKNKTWEYSKMLAGKKLVGCKWVFAVKHNSDGSVNHFKARLVSKGFTQSYGIDYEETFAPVAKLNSICVLLSLVANLDWPLQQLDIRNAFLNGDLEEEVYMEVPPGLESQENFGKVCKLKKSLYDLKQSPRAWFERLTRVVRQHGFTQCQTDHTMFIKHSSNGKRAIMIVYVDDIILTGDYFEEIKYLKEILGREFEIKDLGQLKYFLGMEVARSHKGIYVSQRKYTLDLLKDTGMLGCKPVPTPMDLVNKVQLEETEQLTDKRRYQRLVGKLIYLSHTRPDIGFSVGMVSRYMNEPMVKHLEAVFRILQYLKQNPGGGLFFKKSADKDVLVFTYADWAGCPANRRSTTGYCTYVWGNIVTWCSKKQSVIARSSAEAEFRAMYQGICEGIWLRRMLNELGISNSSPMTLLCDNKVAIEIAKNPIHHDKMKHVEIDRHFIKEKVEEGILSLTYVPTGHQVVDILTKALSRNSLNF